MREAVKYLDDAGAAQLMRAHKTGRPAVGSDNAMNGRDESARPPISHVDSVSRQYRTQTAMRFYVVDTTQEVGLESV